MPRVLIFRTTVGRVEQSFIQDHANRLSLYRPLLLAANLQHGATPDLPPDSVVLRDRWLGPVQDLMFRAWGWAPGLVRRIRRADVLLVHAHFGPDGARVRRLARSLAAPLIVTYHGFDATRSDDALRRGAWGERQYVRGRERLADDARLHIAVSEFVRSRLLSLGFPKERTVVCALGIDTTFFAPGTEPPVRDRVVFAGRLVEAKGCLDLVRAVAKVKESRPDVSVVIVGDGPQHAVIEALAAKHEVPCYITGVMGAEGVRAELHRGVVFCGPSKTAADGGQEALGLAFCEAQACGLPVVAYRSGGVAEAVCHGTTGLLCEEGDEVALAVNLLTILTNDDLRQRMSEAAVVRTRKLFDRSQQVRMLESHYQRILSGSRSAEER